MNRRMPNGTSGGVGGRGGDAPPTRLRSLAVSRFFFETAPVNERQGSDRHHDEKDYGIIQRAVSFSTSFRTTYERASASGEAGVSPCSNSRRNLRSSCSRYEPRAAQCSVRML
jgi:hypothetical protein